MDEIKKKYIVDNENKKVAVQIDIDTFEQIENILEDHGLFKLIQEDNEREYLNLTEAKEFSVRLSIGLIVTNYLYFGKTLNMIDICHICCYL